MKEKMVKTRFRLGVYFFLEPFFNRLYHSELISVSALIFRISFVNRTENVLPQCHNYKLKRVHYIIDQIEKTPI